MKKIITLIFISNLFISINSIAQVIDKDGQTYKTIKIGTQVWMAENLNVSRFRNGEQIIESKTDEEWQSSKENSIPSWCYYNNLPSNGQGKMYNWYAVNDSRGLAPQGWHIPSKEEWTTLANYLGGIDIAGKKLKSTTGWKEGFGTNESGFAGIPNGSRSVNSPYFTAIGYQAYYWTSTSYYEHPESWFCNLDYQNDILNIRGKFPNGYGLSVRCIKDTKLNITHISDNDNINALKYKEDLVGQFAYKLGGKVVIKVTKKKKDYYVSTLDNNVWTVEQPLVDATPDNFKQIFGENWMSFVKVGLINTKGFGIFKVEKGYKFKNSTYKTGYVFYLGFMGGDAYKY